MFCCVVLSIPVYCINKIPFLMNIDFIYFCSLLKLHITLAVQQAVTTATSLQKIKKNITASNGDFK